MGSRVLYEIMGEIDGEKKPVCILYSNSSHEHTNPEDLFEMFVEASLGPTETVERMLGARYGTASGNHRELDRIFAIVTTPYGDYERKLAIDFDADLKQIERVERDNGPKI
jgi:hypothetical protein